MEYYGDNDYREYLAHFGVKGMHWGIRRYQPYSVTGPRKGGKTGKLVGLAKQAAKSAGKTVANIRAGGKKKRIEKERLKNLEKARKVQAEKEKILRSGDADKMLANKEKFTNKELDEFIERANKQTKIAELRKKQVEDGFTKADQIFDKVGKVAGYASTINNLAKQGQDLYKNVNGIKDMINGNSKDAKAKKKEIESIINSADPEKILKNRGKLSGEDMQKAYKRAQTEELLRKMAGGGEDKKKTDGSTTSGSKSESPLTGDVEGTGKNSTSWNYDNFNRGNSRKNNGPIDVDARDVTPRGSIGESNKGGRSDNGGGGESSGPAPSGGSSPRPTSPSSSGGGGAALALPAPARQAAKSSSMSDGIKLTFESAGGSNTKASAAKWEAFGKQSTAGIDKSSEAFKKNQDYVDEAIRNINDLLSGR